ncbi:PAP2 superfamily protein [Xylariomycetidae sp. FL2044]|nr:PAP2 superfamily protein [Xylariomycetidae sp. FL2044]
MESPSGAARADQPDLTTPAPEAKRRRQLWSKLHAEPYSTDHRPTFGQWLKLTWPDLLTMAVVGAIAAVVVRYGPPATRYFPLTVRTPRSPSDDGPGTDEVVYPQFAYPQRRQIISSLVDGVLGVGVPIVVILLAQIRLRSFWDLNNGLMGLLYAILGSTFFQAILKWLIGGLRPNFYDICQPDPSRVPNGGVGYQHYMYTVEVCTVKRDHHLWNAMQSFPSGHSVTIWAGATYLFLYLNAKLKVFSNRHSAMWKLILLYLPILGAVLICGSLTIDHTHNWYDIVAGSIIGIVFAFSAYRMVYASIWDWRTNHIPLNRQSSTDNETDTLPPLV